MSYKILDNSARFSYYKPHERTRVVAVFYRQHTGDEASKYVYQLTDHLGNVRAVIKKPNSNNLEILGATDYYPFGMPMPNRHLQDANAYRYAYQGQEKDPETGKEAFKLRLWDGRIGRWLTTDPKGQYASPYLGMGNNPINGIDPDGGDVIVLVDTKAVSGLGHAAVLIGNKEKGWRYVSMNGTGKHALMGIDRNKNLGEIIIGKGLTVKEVIGIVNKINIKAKHNYDTYRVIKSNDYEDNIAYNAARNQAAKYWYCVSNQSCIDVPQVAVEALIRYRGFNLTDPYDNFGFDEQIPNYWIKDLDLHARDMNYFYNNPPTSLFQWILNGFKNSPKPDPKVILEVGPPQIIEIE